MKIKILRMSLSYFLRNIVQMYFVPLFQILLGFLSKDSPKFPVLLQMQRPGIMFSSDLIALEKDTLRERNVTQFLVSCFSEARVCTRLFVTILPKNVR